MSVFFTESAIQDVLQTLFCDAPSCSCKISPGSKIKYLKSLLKKTLLDSLIRRAVDSSLQT